MEFEHYELDVEEWDEPKDREGIVAKVFSEAPVASKADVLDVLEYFCDVTRGGLRAFLNRSYEEPEDVEAPWKSKTHECPGDGCEESAETNAELQETFGTRVINGKVYNQSYCRSCR